MFTVVVTVYNYFTKIVLKYLHCTYLIGNTSLLVLHEMEHYINLYLYILSILNLKISIAYIYRRVL